MPLASLYCILQQPCLHLTLLHTHIPATYITLPGIPSQLQLILPYFPFYHFCVFINARHVHIHQPAHHAGQWGGDRWTDGGEDGGLDGWWGLGMPLLSLIPTLGKTEKERREGEEGWGCWKLWEGENLIQWRTKPDAPSLSHCVYSLLPLSSLSDGRPFRQEGRRPHANMPLFPA